VAKGDWWFKFDFKVWRTDSNLRRCSLETRGFWLEVLCVMHEADDCQIEGSYEELGWLIGCSPEVVARCVLELKRTGTADVTLGNGNVTLVSRRLKRDVSVREQTRLRVQKSRSNADVTVQSKSNKKEERKEEKKEDVCAVEIFKVWAEVLDHPKAVCDAKRIKYITSRLKEGFSVEDLKQVPYGVKNSPHHLGQNPTGTKYDGIETIYRDAAQVEKFVALAPQNGNGLINGRKLGEFSR